MPHFGPRIIGDAAFEEQAKVEAKGAVHFGSRVVGDPEPEVVETPSYSISEVTAMVFENPALVPQLAAAEFARAEGPRKGALRVLHKVGTESNADPAVLEQLTAALA